MKPTGRRKFNAIVLLIAVSLGAVSVPIVAAPATNGHSDSDACCAPDESRATECAGEQDAPSDEDGCCPNGCRDCFLPCCGGAVTSLTASPAFSPVWGPATSVASAVEDFSSVSAADVFHPPRS